MASLPEDPFKLRLMRPQDLAGVAAIQASSYHPHYLEDDATLAARLRECADTSWVAEGPGGLLGAYLVAYRSVLGKVTPLGAHFDPPPQPNCLYLHDLAVAAHAAGQGLGPALVRQALALARREGLACSALVSVQESQAFWRRLGYGAQALDDAQQQAHLASYPGVGVYMVQALGD
ncbi:Ribosomal protein S18 acetylase RimI [Polaromonas sp. YR568]|uniref:GNAT family N-acetyltransferase n=1 Tax=Polaromonas sp. YR568 TaxID=1855301 RepID=UPI0008E2FF8E|nr:N-acetyltransferase [Polaromonas sp. YR568]SFU59266.1 Ribosomal protein S18 acetylase RimI [Polaromonas sp. YR568]